MDNIPNDESNLIIYNSKDGRVKVALMARDGQVWMNQAELAKLFGTSVPNINLHIANILQDGELDINSVIKFYLITASDGKQYNVKFYSLDMIFSGCCQFCNNHKIQHLSCCKICNN